MANPFDESEDEVAAAVGVSGDDMTVKEGLLCPVCVQDFKTIGQLRDHFETNHKQEFAAQQTNQTKQLGLQIKGFITKTKKILKNDNNLTIDDGGSESLASGSSGQSYVDIWRRQMTIGETRNHLDWFRKIRDSRIERYVIETNKLLIRLDKLITDAPKDPEKRKLHERSIVVWANDVDVRLCPNCAKSFNLSRRRHHCRLCGGIMCHNCSQFLDFIYARKLISPTNLDEASLAMLPRTKSASTSNLTRRGSSSSLLSIVNQSGEPHIRVCRDCKTLLARRDQQIEDNLAKPILAQFYDRMRQQLKDIERLTPLYYQMSDSLNLGETNYSLLDAQELKLKLTKLAESVDSISKKIATLGSQDEQQPHPKQQQLQTSIRSSVTHFLRQTMLGLPALPTPDELRKYQEQRRLEIDKRIQYERQLALEDQQRYASPKRQTVTLSNNFTESTASRTDNDDSVIVSPEDGWNPEFASNRRSNREDNGSGADNGMDPMLQQINIIRNYIRQAREAHKYDELHMLEENLKELEIEYFVQQHGNQTQESHSSS
ncbi:rabenosyn-5-like [Oppia nitens]|uniref:rabenosyn-5-like n=1 Tax=Oppia nitens TaxID=1686743 RepID=UPI0023DB0F28|nr:rabenosyn-5-like [Oppia nitens]